MSGSVGGVDANIPLRAGQGAGAPQDPLSTIGRFATIQNQLNQAQLFPGQLKLQGQQIEKGGVDNAKLINQAAYASLAPYVNDPDFTMAKLTTHLASVEHNLHLPTNGVLSHIQAIPFAPDTPQWRAAVQNTIASQMQTDPTQVYSHVAGTPAVQVSGQEIFSGVTSPTHRGGGFAGGSRTQIEPGPETLMATRPVTVTPEIARQYGLPDETIGTTLNIPTGTASPYRGTEGAQAPRITNVPGRGNQIAPNFDPVTGNPLTYSSTPPPMPPWARPGGPSPLSGGVGPVPPLSPRDAATINGAPRIGGLPMGALPGSMATGANEEITQNQQAFRAAQSAAKQLPINNTQFIEAHEAISRLQHVVAGTGAAQAAIAQARRIANNLGLGFSEEVKDTAMAEKYLSAAIASKSGRSDAQQALQEVSNPTLKTPAGASLPMIRQIIANNRADQIIVESADQKGNRFLSHQESTSRLLNSKEGLAALAWDITPPSERAKFQKSIDGNEAATKRFYDALRMAHNMKHLTPPGASQ